MMARVRHSMIVVVSALAMACGGSAAEDTKAPAQAAAATSDFDPCALLTYEEINGAVGWTPDSAVKAAYGSTGNCNYFGPNALLQQVSLLVAPGMPDMSDSRKMADWRAKQYADYKVTDAIVEPLEGLGVPAIRNEFGIVAVEMALGGQLVSVSSISAKLDQVKALAGHVLARMQ